MLLEKNVVGKKTDWANYITLADEHETPVLRLLPKGPKPVNVVKNYQADTYNDPQTNAWPDGKDWDTFKSAGANRVALAARVQWFVQTAAVSKLAEDVTDTAGITDELAHEIPKKMTEMAREMEASACSDQVSFADDGTTGNKFRGMGAWINNAPTADADVAIGTSILTPAASIYSNTKANLNEDAVIAVLQSMWDNTGSVGRKLGVLGKNLKKRFRDFQFFIPSNFATQSTSRMTMRDESSGTLGNTIDNYDSDWGMLELHMTKWNAHPNFTSSGTASISAWRGYFLNPARWGWLWNQKPTVYKPEFRGGSYKAAIDAILMFLCWNPIGEGKVIPSDA
jgi:Family of unknown function (DUF5309)